MRHCIRGMLFLGLAVIATIARSDEAKIELSDVPSGGVEAVKTMFPKAAIKGAAKETEDGKTVFEIALKQEGRNIDVTVDSDGKIQVVEKEIVETDLPVAVKDRLKAKYPKATFKVIEQVDTMKNGKPVLDFYEAHLITADGRSIEVEIAPDGSIKLEENKKSGDED